MRWGLKFSCENVVLKFTRNKENRFLIFRRGEFGQIKEFSFYIIWFLTEEERKDFADKRGAEIREA